MALPLTFRERSAAGRLQRKHMRRADHAGWTPHKRTESPIKLLEVSVRGRVPELIDLKNQRMSLSPFAFYRGAVPVMAYDLSLAQNTAIQSQLCGDAHVRNLGAFDGPDGRLVFDINDFDETIAGPFEWDVKRMATSLILAGRGINAKHSDCEEGAAIFLANYRRSILRLSRMPVLEAARYQVRRLRDISTMSTIFTMAQRATPMHSLISITEPPPEPASAAAKVVVKKQSAAKSKPATTGFDLESALAPAANSRIFHSNPPNLTRITGAPAQRIIDSLTTYVDSLLVERRHFFAQYRPIDVAFKVVGTGSVGLRDYCVYMQGNSAKDPLFIQIKEEAASSYAPYLGGNTVPPYHQGRRVVEGERAMQVQSDPLLGWTTIEGRDYLVRQLNDHKASIDITQMKVADLLAYASVCGEMLARGHSRSGDAAMLAGYIGTSERFDNAITKFAVAYADQTERDWKQFAHSLKPTASQKLAAKSPTKPKKKSKPAPQKKSRKKSKAKPKPGPKRKS
jgi:uncharacterized protein (DUF2252 family)